MKSFFNYYNNKWYTPILFAIAIGFVCFFTIQLQNKHTFLLSLTVPFIALICSGIAGIIRIIKKDYIKGIFQIITTGIIGMASLFIGINLYLLNPYDFYADSLKIPQNIETHFPLAEDNFNTTSSIECKKNDFYIYNSFQPGLYYYEICLGKIDSGLIYLQAYEITQNDILSQARLGIRSAIGVFNNSDSLQRIKSKSHFTIYEGDWNKPYAARFEVWYRKYGSQKDIKLTEKNYIIEGWQR